MDTSTTAMFGILFVALGVSATFLMYHLWGYPFDKETRKSAAPKWAMYLHRGIGYLFAICYVVLMTQMLPRLWEYQVEFKAATVAHILLGFTVGFLLVLKIAIMRFFRHFEEWMPYLGTAILLCTILLMGLSLPVVFQERALRTAAPGGGVYSDESRARVARLLPSAQLSKDAPLAELSSVQALKKGRRVLLTNCVRCHDLKTIITKPRRPESWGRIVARMATKPALFSPIDDSEQWQVTAYLIAITPELQQSVKRVREMEKAKAEARKAAASPPASGDSPAPGDATTDTPPPQPAVPKVDPKQAKTAFEDECSQCHELSDVHDNPPKSHKETDELILRMIEDNEFEADKPTIELIRWYMNAHYVDKKL